MLAFGNRQAADLRRVARRRASEEIGARVRNHHCDAGRAAVRTRRLRDEERGWLAGYASLIHQLGAEFVRLDDRNVAKAVVRHVRDVQATEVVLGHRSHARRLPWDTTSEIIRMLSGVDVHILRARQIATIAPVT